MNYRRIKSWAGQTTQRVLLHLSSLVVEEGTALKVQLDFLVHSRVPGFHRLGGSCRLCGGIGRGRGQSRCVGESVTQSLRSSPKN